MIRKTIVIILTIVTILTLGVSLVGCCRNSGKVGDDIVLSSLESEVVEEEYHINQVTTITPMLRLSSGTATISDNSKSQVITATCYPEHAGIKDVTWSVEWGEYSGKKPVTDYVTISPNGSSCTVICHQSFSVTNTILVKATSVDNPSVYGTCTVTYKGFPEYYQYYFGFNTSNKYSVEDVYVNMVRGYSLFTITSYNSLGGSYQPELELVGYGAEGTYSYNEGANAGLLFRLVDDIIKSVDVSGTVINVTINQTLDEYVSANLGSSVFTKDCYFYVTVKDVANNDALITIKFI